MVLHGEIGVRLALGAAPAQMLLAAALAQASASVLYGVSASGAGDADRPSQDTQGRIERCATISAR